MRHALAERRRNVRDDAAHSRLLLGREVALGVELADGISHRRLRGGQRTLVARALVSVKASGRLGECARQHVGVLVDQMKAEIVLPRLEWSRCDERRDTLHGRGLPCDDHLLRPEPRGVEEFVPVHARRVANEVRSRPLIVGVAVDGRRLTRGMRHGDGPFERQHRLGALIGVIESRERQQARDVLLISAALLDGAGLRTEVSVTIPECEAALHQERGICLLTVDAVLHGEPQDRR